MDRFREHGITSGRKRFIAGLVCALLATGAWGQSAPGVNEKNATSKDATQTTEDQRDANGPAPAKTGQADTTTSTAGAGSSRLSRSVLGQFVGDQKSILLAPLGVRLRDVVWLAPLAGVTAGLVTQDASVSRHLNSSASRISNSNSFSNYGVAALAGGSLALYGWGKLRGNDQQRETGWIAGEAMASTFADVGLMKYGFGRARPQEKDGSGRFRDGGQSFPSEHAALAWSAATVLAHQYPGPLTKLLAYGGAAAISAARVTGKQHFPSDVLIGGALGYFIGNRVWERYHEREDEAGYGEFVRASEHDRDPGDMGSPYVPLDSWVYPAFDRLSALGYAPSAFMGLRPWTRMECARLLQESQDLLAGSEADAPEAARLQQSLAGEFVFESARLDGGDNFGAHVDSVYTRWTNISGAPLRDGYHFAQTLVNDYGRPYGAGNNAVAGFTSHVVAGPLAIFVQGEYQHAPALPAYSATTLNAIAAREVGLAPINASPSLGADDVRLLDSYVALQTHDLQFSFGKQSLWWGPGEGGAMMFTDNAEPIYMLRVSRTTPIELPSVFRFLGPMRGEFFIGRLSGQHRIATERGHFETVQSLDPQPYMHGQKISFHPTANLQFGVSRTTIFAGPDFPLTTHRFLHSMFSSGNSFGGNDPGDRRSGFDFSYRLPKLRDWVQWYADGFTEDQLSPIGYADRASWRTGIYMPKLPRLPKMDLRAEGTYTDWPIGVAFPGFNYTNVRYIDGLTNYGQLMADWIGRQGHGVEGWLRYWVNPESTVEFGYRKQMVSPDFLQGGSLDDFSGRAEFKLHNDVSVTTNLQYERWTFPLLASTQQSNFTTSVQLTFRPRLGRK